MASGSEIQSWKFFEPLSLLAQEYTAALMRVTLRGFLGFPGITGFRRSRTGSGISGAGSRISAKGVDDGSVSTEGELLDSCCDSCHKMMLPNTQSIKGLYQVSQQYPSTIVQLWSNGVM